MRTIDWVEGRVVTIEQTLLPDVLTPCESRRHQRSRYCCGNQGSDPGSASAGIGLVLHRVLAGVSPESQGVMHSLARTRSDATLPASVNAGQGRQAEYRRARPGLPRSPNPIPTPQDQA